MSYKNEAELIMQIQRQNFQRPLDLTGIANMANQFKTAIEKRQAEKKYQKGLHNKNEELAMSGYKTLYPPQHQNNMERQSFIEQLLKGGQNAV